MCNRPSKIEFAYLKLLPRASSGCRLIVAVGHRPDGLREYEERSGAPPINGPVNDENVIPVYLVRAPETGSEIR